jgi:hypothetical protein
MPHNVSLWLRGTPITPEDWARVKWSDECTVERDAGIQPLLTFRRPWEQLIEGDYTKCGKGVEQIFELDFERIYALAMFH